jgi:hypothetical protein
MCCTLLNRWLLLLVYLWHNQKLTNMQYTHFPTVFFANLQSPVVLMFNYCRNKIILCFLQLTHPLTSALVAQIHNEKEHSSSLLSKLSKYTGTWMCCISKWDQYVMSSQFDVSFMCLEVILQPHEPLLSYKTICWDRVCLLGTDSNVHATPEKHMPWRNTIGI